MSSETHSNGNDVEFETTNNFVATDHNDCLSLDWKFIGTYILQHGQQYIGTQIDHTYMKKRKDIKKQLQCGSISSKFQHI